MYQHHIIMINKILIFIFLIFLSNCSAPGSALLGPIFTGAKTGSVAQASLSYSSNILMDELKLKDAIKKVNKINKDFSKNNSTLPNPIYTDKDPIILIAYKIDKVNISDIIDPEPLP